MKTKQFIIKINYDSYSENPEGITARFLETVLYCGFDCFSSTRHRVKDIEIKEIKQYLE